MTFVWRHPSGGEMTLPDRWQVVATQVGLALVPPDLVQGAELYLVNAAPATGIERADDPRVIALVDQSLRQQVPMLGPPTIEPGVRVRWDGGAVIAIAWLQIVQDAIAGVIAVGARANVTAREPVLEQIFASFGRGEATRDPALVGTWHHWSYRATGMYTAASTSSETRRVCVLAADGSVIERSSHEGAGNFTDLGGFASTSSGGRVGKWTGGGGILHVEWSDGAIAEWQYRIEGTPRRLLLFTPGHPTPVEWTEQPQ